MSSRQALAVGLWVMLLATSVTRAASGDFERQTITVPTKSVASQVRSLFTDVDSDGLSDLLAVGPAENALWLFRQRVTGFPVQPDQAIGLPPQTAWITVSEVDANPNSELLLSTAAGLAYLRQDRGVFDSQYRTLVETRQVFTNGDPPVLIAPNLLKNGTNDVIPLVSERGVALYQRNPAFEWSLGERMKFAPSQTRWTVQEDEWMMGSKRPSSMRIQKFFRVKLEDNLAGQKPENEAIKQFIQETEKERHGREHGMDRVDINGDGQPDVILWKFAWDVDPKTDVCVFLRGANGQLPEQPSQVLHARGFPLRVGLKQDMSPVCDLDGDGIHELMLLALKSLGISSGKVLEMVISRGVDWNLTIRSFRQGEFARSPDASISMTTTLPADRGPQELFVTDADFNGDGRPDVMARRSLTEWDVFPSSKDGKWFASQPARTIEVPMDGDFEIRDLNGDGISDIVVRGRDEPRLLLLLSQSPRKKGPQ